MVTINVLDRVLFIKGVDYGTAFTIDVDGRQYLVTAKHLIASDVGSTSIQYFFAGMWRNASVIVVGTGAGEVDVAVLAASLQLSPEIEFPPSIGGFALGQDVYFVGFPFKSWSDAGPLMYGRPVGFIKKGCVSAAFSQNEDAMRLYIDATNSPGCSGGPLVLPAQAPDPSRVIGVVSKFRLETEAVLDKDGNETDLRVAYNTGIMVAYSIKYALDIISRNPIGVKLPSALDEHRSRT